MSRRSVNLETLADAEARNEAGAAILERDHEPAIVARLEKLEIEGIKKNVETWCSR